MTLSGQVQVWVHDPDLHEPQSPCSWLRSVLSVFKGYAFGPLGQGRADLPEGSHSDGYFSEPLSGPCIGRLFSQPLPTTGSSACPHTATHRQPRTGEKRFILEETELILESGATQKSPADAPPVPGGHPNSRELLAEQSALCMKEHPGV